VLSQRFWKCRRGRQLPGCPIALVVGLHLSVELRCHTSKRGLFFFLTTVSLLKVLETFLIFKTQKAVSERVEYFFLSPLHRFSLFFCAKSFFILNFSAAHWNGKLACRWQREKKHILIKARCRYCWVLRTTWNQSGNKIQTLYVFSNRAWLDIKIGCPTAVICHLHSCLSSANM